MKESSFESGNENNPADVIERSTQREADIFEEAFTGAKEGEQKMLVTGYGQAEGLMTQVAIEDFLNNSEQEA